MKIIKMQKEKKTIWELLRPFARSYKRLIGFKLCTTTCNRVCKRRQHVTSNIVISLDFHSTKQGLPLVDSWSRGVD